MGSTTIQAHLSAQHSGQICGFECKNGRTFGSPPYLVQDELSRAMNAFSKSVALFEQERALAVRAKTAVLVPIRAFAQRGASRREDRMAGVYTGWFVI